jgi:HemY protein
MIKLVLFFFVLLVSVLLGVKLQHDPGTMLIVYNHWRIETTLWVGVGLLILIFIFFHVFLLLFSWLGGLRSSWRQWQARRRSHASQTKTRKGLIEFSEGHWKRATNYLIKALPDADTPLLNYLTAARAAQEMGDHQMRDDFLRDAQHCVPEAKIAVELTQAQLQLANRQWEQALATLRHLKDLSPNHPYVLKLLIELYQEVKDWRQLIALLPDLKRNKVVSGNAYDQLEHQAYLQALMDLVKQGDSVVIDEFFNAMPKQLIQTAPFVAVYGRYLLKTDCVQAELRLRQSLRKEFNESLIELYGDIQSTEGLVARLEFAESLLKKNAHSASLRLCLGELSQMHQLWGKAKTYFEESIQLSPKPIAYAKLGALLEQLGDQAGAHAAYRQGLQLALK